ncbi:hypothetical protein J1605_012972 [Eschrichtius robustus]|uniref:Uncharacterized protein n=1 Tax=Eschrichtius robustus TaxID=9764 RepID=A0AB34GJY0_ESCRO|nr:hypothetical protein J1605_012972 [Eschrichtius robustus]
MLDSYSPSQWHTAKACEESRARLETSVGSPAQGESGGLACHIPGALGDPMCTPNYSLVPEHMERSKCQASPPLRKAKVPWPSWSRPGPSQRPWTYVREGTPGTAHFWQRETITAPSTAARVPLVSPALRWLCGEASVTSQRSGSGGPFHQGAGTIGPTQRVPGATSRPTHPTCLVPGGDSLGIPQSERPT